MKIRITCLMLVLCSFSVYHNGAHDIENTRVCFKIPNHEISEYNTIFLDVKQNKKIIDKECWWKFQFDEKTIKWIFYHFTPTKMIILWLNSK